MVEGRHIKIVGVGGESSVEPMGDVKTIERLLYAVVDLVGMRPLAPAQVHDVPVEILKLGAIPFEDEGGVTGVLILSTSHCTIHTWPLRKKFVFDLYSCRDFDPMPVVEMVTTALKAKAYTYTDVSDSLRDP
jgi:S-adenosylmethionine/arginine decarboxylase-like enzyme